MVGSVAGGQSAQAPPSATFEVASIKPNDSGDPRLMVQMAPGRLTLTNSTAKWLIQTAFQVQAYQIQGGPSWLTSNRFDINAKVEGDPTPERISSMIRSLLADRFRLVSYTEKRELPVYELVVAAESRKLGAKLRQSMVDCTPGRGNPASARPQRPDERIACGIRMGPGSLSLGGAAISQLANFLAPFVNRVIVDKTGLRGNFDVDLNWAVDQQALRPPDADSSASDANTPSLFTALQEQLGLRLDSRKGLVDVVVVENIEQPSPD
jgi:uncharacterized protein (TIGR03435 family)